MHRLNKISVTGLIIVLVMLYNVIGVTALATIAAMIGQNLYQVAVARISYRYQQEVQLAADDRLSLTSEIMHSIKTLKFLAWEDGFAERLQEKRTVELRKFRKQTAIRALISGVTCTSDRIQSSGIWFICANIGFTSQTADLS